MSAGACTCVYVCGLWRGLVVQADEGRGFAEVWRAWKGDAQDPCLVAVGCRLVCKGMNGGPRQKEKGLRLGLVLRVLLGLVWVPT